SRTVREKIIQVGKDLLTTEGESLGDLSRDDVTGIVLQSCCDLAQDYQRSGLHGKAAQILSLGREMVPDEPRLLEQMGDLYAEAGSIDRLAEVAEQLASLYRKRGEIENIGDAYERLLSVDPGNLLGLERLVEWEQERGSLIGRFQMALSFANALSSKGLVGRAAEILRQARSYDMDALSNLSDDDREAALQRILQATEKLASLNKARGEIREITLDRNLLAGQLAAQQCHEQAIAIASEVVQDAPQESAAWLVLASSYHATGQLERALESYTRLAEFFDTEATLTDRDSIRRAEDAYRTILALDPQALWAEENLARLLSRSGREREALDLLQALLEKIRKTKDVGRVISVARLIVSLDPNDRDALSVLKDTLTERGDTAGALGVLDSLVAILRRESSEKGKPSADVLDLLKQRIQLQPGRVEYRTELADFLAQTGEVEKATAEWSAVAEIFISQGRADLAEKAFEKQIGLSPQSPRIREAFGGMLRSVGRLQDSAANYAIAARLYHEQNHVEESLKDVRTALQIDPWSEEAMQA
ncbi:MAG TPA: tetratricopeptide repeat protein, partial [bacterium]|nr:tetratricopeptide repeat protein [bacterium]